MNLYATSPEPYLAHGFPRPPTTSPTPSGRTVVEGYRNDILTGFQKDPPRFNPVGLLSYRAC